MSISFRRFRVQLVMRLAVFGVALYGCFHFWGPAQNPLLGGLAAGVVLWQGYALIRDMERTTRDVVRFLEAIEYDDFVQSFSAPYPDSSFQRLYGAFGNVMRTFQRTRAATEAQRRYLETLVHHVGIGLLCFRPDGSVTLMNTAAKRLLDRPYLKNTMDLMPENPALANVLWKIKSTENQLVPVQVGDDTLQMTVYATRFKLQGDAFTLVSFQNIDAQLEARELDAMQHMTRVLAHEIMNSITPIASLAASAQDHLRHYTTAALDTRDPQTPADLQDALHTIEKRSRGLMHFVDAYRSIARIPRPNFELLPVKGLFRRPVQLMKDRLDEASIQVHVEVEPETLKVLGDTALLEQVLINLLTNAADALVSHPDGQIDLKGQLDRQGRVVLTVADNGPGMPPEVLDSIFIPFFTTKKTGSGIGLSFSRQVMHRHHGHLRVQSQVGGPTTFILRF